MNTRFFMFLLESRHFACSPLLCGDIFHGHALPCFGDIMACQRRCRDVDVPLMRCVLLFPTPCVSYTSIWSISSPRSVKKFVKNSMQAPFSPRCQPSLHTKTHPNVAERWIVSVEKISSVERRADAPCSSGQTGARRQKKSVPCGTLFFV